MTGADRPGGHGGGRGSAASRTPEVPGARVLYTADRIRRKVASIARRIEKAQAGREVVLVGVLKGGIFFLADLARELRIPARIDFMRLRSYGDETSPGEVRITKDVETDVQGRDVVVVEDIVDTGCTMRFLARHFRGRKARSIRFCALLDKRERREVDVELHYAGFRIRKGFVVGYGMDCAERFRNLPDIHVLPPGSGEGTSSVGGKE